MKRNKLNPSVNYNYHKSGSLNEVLNDFINVMKEFTGEDVNVNVDIKGKVTVYFGNDYDIECKRPDNTADPEDKETRNKFVSDIEDLYYNRYEI